MDPANDFSEFPDVFFNRKTSLFQVVDCYLSLQSLGFIFESGPQTLHEQIHIPQLWHLLIMEAGHPLGHFPF